MTEPVFDIRKCSIETVFPISTEDWFERLAVPQSPQAIDDCADEPIQMPDPDPPCPTLLPNEGTSSVNFGCAPHGETRFTIAQGDCCDFTFDFLVSVPCPQFPDSRLREAPWRNVPYGLQQLRWRFKPYACNEDDGDMGERGCGFDFDIEIDFPCPQLPQKVVTTSGTWGSIQLSVWVTEPYGFDFDLDSNFDIPCPQIPGTVYGDCLVKHLGEEYANITFTRGDDCSFDVNLEVGFPFPQIPIKTDYITEDWGDVTLNFTVTDPYGFDFDIDANVNIPCPQFPYDAEAETTIVPLGSERASIGVRPREKSAPFMLNLVYQNESWLECASNANLTATESSFEVGCWVQLRAPSRKRQVLMSKWDSDTGYEWELICEGDGTGYNYFRFRCVIGGTEYSVDSRGYNTPLHACHLVRAWHDIRNDSIGLAVDEMYSTPVSVTGTRASSSAPFRIGADKDLGVYHFCDSKVGGAYFYSRAVPTGDAALIYNSGQVRPWPKWLGTALTANIVSHWSFDDGPYANSMTASDDIGTNDLQAMPANHGIETVKSSCPAMQANGAIKNCEYEFAMEVDFPCPQFPSEVVTATTRTVDPVNKWAAITFTAAEECGFDIDFDIDFPCVRLPAEQIDAVVYSTPKGTEHAWIKFTQDEEGECIFDVDMEIAFPCPVFPSGKVYALTRRVTPGLEQAWIEFLQDPYHADCNRFDVQFEVDFPFPQDAGDGTGYKLAIMPCGTENVGLFCSEMPTPYFMDYVEATLPPGETKIDVPIDEKFMRVCEPGSVRCTAYTADLPIPVGTVVKSGYLRVRRRSEDCTDAVTVLATVSGVRRGRRGLRFPNFSQEQMERNNAFWTKAYV